MLQLTRLCGDFASSILPFVTFLITIKFFWSWCWGTMYNDPANSKGNVTLPNALEIMYATLVHTLREKWGLIFLENFCWQIEIVVLGVRSGQRSKTRTVMQQFNFYLLRGANCSISKQWALCRILVVTTKW